MRTLILLREQTINHCIKVNNRKCFFFWGCLFFQLQVLFPGNLRRASVSIQNQSTQIQQPQGFLITWFFQTNEMKQKQTGHVLLMSRATWTNNFLSQKAVFTTMKSCTHFLISNEGARWKFCWSSCMDARKMHEQIQNVGMTKKIIKKQFYSTSN